MTSRFSAVLALAVLASGCTEPLETLGPTPAGEGITVFIHTGYAGTSQGIDHDVRDLQRVEGPCTNRAEGEEPTWEDCISSIRVAPGWSVTLYRDDDFEGRSVTLTADSPDLRALPGPCDGSFNDCVSSLRVRKE